MITLFNDHILGRILQRELKQTLWLSRRSPSRSISLWNYDTENYTEIFMTLKNIYKGNHSDNPGLSHWNIFLCCSRTLKSHWKILNHTETFSVLLISFVPRFFSIILYFQCDFQCHNFIVYSALHALAQILKIQSRDSVKFCHSILVLEHITHSLGKERAILCPKTNWGNTSGVLVRQTYRHVLGYCQVIFQISQFSLIIFGW